jgi:protein-S-isoprenylcysteine O-methyltransferase Ste14
MIYIFLIFLSFAFIHSVTVSHRFKDYCRRAFGETFMRAWYRFLYTMVSGITVVIALFFIIQVPDRVLWDPPGWLRWSLHGVQVAGGLFGMRAFEYLDAWEFLGFRQAWRYFARKETAGNIEGLTEKDLIMTGVYGIVRHPVYVAGIVVVTFSPRFTVNNLTFTVLADLYFLFGMLIEERRFLRIFGDRYRQYMRTVPRMFPRIRSRSSLP